MIKRRIEANRITVLNDGGYDGWVGGSNFPLEIADAADVEQCYTIYGNDFVEIPFEVLEKHGYDRKVGLEYDDFGSSDTGLIFRLRQQMIFGVEAVIHEQHE
ncbi:hypothetical protein [Gibbsiella quercinecans]|uniref:hypothetical protein n=1 Tax=Gibbsiella quercinecans TaxID=929813 RepID=UPI00242E11ED|nr:hypothetical protein [Gibbsiella quercinecans]